MVSLLVVAALIGGVSTVLAAKPDSSTGNDVIARSNGFPSGAHFNLNIHGKNADFVCDSTPGGGSVFVDEYGPATIQYVTNKKSGVTELTVLDPCAVDGGTAKVQLPYQAEGYYVFARILAKPNNGTDGSVSSIILYPNEVVEACNDTDPANPDFPGYTECPDDPELALGLIVGSNLYVAEPEQYVRFDLGATPGKGNSKATDITRLFIYTGWVLDARLDWDGDGDVDCDDVIGWNIDYDLDGDVDCYDLDDMLEYWRTQDPPMAWYFEAEWIFNIADLVITEQGLENDGTKLVQIRFYPVATTVYTAPTPTPTPTSGP